MLNFVKDEARAREGAFSQFDMEAIYPALQEMLIDDVYLEVGVMNGRSLEFARRYSKGRIFGIDISPLEEPVEGATFIQKSSNEAVKDWNLPIKVLFIDGDHTYRGVKDDWNNFSPFVTDWVFLHDCDETSPGVVELFEEIKGWEKKLFKTSTKNTYMARLRKL